MLCKHNVFIVDNLVEAERVAERIGVFKDYDYVYGSFDLSRFDADNLKRPLMINSRAYGQAIQGGFLIQPEIIVGVSNYREACNIAYEKKWRRSDFIFFHDTMNLHGMQPKAMRKHVIISSNVPHGFLLAHGWIKE